MLIEDLKNLLAEHGLEICTLHERNLLNVCKSQKIVNACHPDGQCCYQQRIKCMKFANDGEQAICVAELARRNSL